MVEAGDITDKQGIAMYKRLAEAHPEADQGSAENFIATAARLLDAFAGSLGNAERAYCLWRWKHCDCPSCCAAYQWMSWVCNDDGTPKLDRIGS
jgi:hypothetical protein